MRKLAARSISVALVAVLVSGCSTSGGKKSFSWSSMNPMTYFAKSDSDSPVPKPSDQMAPTVTLGNASDVVSTTGSSGGMAPPSPYGKKPSYSDSAKLGNTMQSSSISPQRGSYDPNGYAGGSLPLSPSSPRLDQYPAQTSSTTTGYNLPSSGLANYQAPVGGYQMPQNGPSVDVNQSAQYAIGGGSYDIQNQMPASSPTRPSYAASTSPYANTAASSGGLNSSPYQSPPLPPVGSGYDAPSTPWGGGVNSANSYANSSLGTSAESRDMGGIASLPQLPPLPSEYTNNQPPYVPGNTGYNPPNVPTYTPPSPGGYVEPASAIESSYAPGSISRYPSVPSQTIPTTGSVY